MEWQQWTQLSDDERDAAARSFIDAQLATKDLARAKVGDRGRYVTVYPILGWTPMQVWAKQAPRSR